MKKLFFLGLLFFIQINFAQKIRVKIKDTTNVWDRVNKLGFDFTQSTFDNWNAGGNNSISGIFKGNFQRNFIKGNFKFNNELIIRYGVAKQQNIEWRKTDDVFQINSIAGFRKDSLSHWYYAARFNFSTQHTNGYNYPNTDKAISKPFAPAYIFLGIGAEYSKKELNFSGYVSPLTLKSTLVFDKDLADEGAFGVEKAIFDSNGNKINSGKSTRTELGFLISGQYKRDVMQNIHWETRFQLYADYLNNFGNFDIDWQNTLEMTINKYVKASFMLHVIYDDDIKSKEIENNVTIINGPRLQIKQIIGVGLLWSF